ncbi:hypothetical protein SDC9_188289 [bioreactor metagenome]|uniref:Uncharacterized protein n=1 Tax=bioreactor metagenome TaxID=1076179 RepID=A0A645HPI3_9ZZZZ
MSPRKISKGYSADQLKFGGALPHFVRAGQHLLRHIDKVVIRNGNTIDPHSLVKPSNIGRRAQTGDIARLL